MFVYDFSKKTGLERIASTIANELDVTCDAEQLPKALHTAAARDVSRTYEVISEALKDGRARANARYSQAHRWTSLTLGAVLIVGIIAVGLIGAGVTVAGSIVEAVVTVFHAVA